MSINQRVIFIINIIFSYLEKQWFSKSYNYYNYSDIFKIHSLKKILPHFYATNNIEESLHSKINNYLPTRKISCNNFILSLRNILQYNELKKNDIPRKDYITKTLVYYADTIKDNNYSWLEYDKFKEMEKKIITESNNKYNEDQINEIINSINGLNLKENSNENNLDANTNIDNNNSNIILQDDNSLPDQDEIDISMNDNLSEENLDDQDDASFSINNADLFDRLLKDKRFINYKDLIVDIKNEKKDNLKQNRHQRDPEEDLDMDYLNELLSKKTKVRYPKK